MVIVLAYECFFPCSIFKYASQNFICDFKMHFPSRKESNLTTLEKSHEIEMLRLQLLPLEKRKRCEVTNYMK